MPMSISQNGLRFIANQEGTGPVVGGLFQVYNDVAGNPTVGYGHKLTQEEIAENEFEDGLNEDDALSLLQRDASSAADAVNRYVNVDLNQNQFDALVDFTYNVGSGNLYSSTLLTLLNAGNYDAVPTQLLRWNRSGGQVVDGLTNRRTAEGQLFTTPV
jgi:lysozyme